PEIFAILEQVPAGRGGEIQLTDALAALVRERKVYGCEFDGDRYDIGDKLGRYPGELSQGEKQRVAICRALLPGPKLVFADEATGNLDPRNKGRILDLLFDSVDAHGATLLAVTHDHELLPRFDRVVDFLDFRGEGGD
ncbi:MAG: ATP-binding cassette domain-containing protein, partial [Gammaproteobacteria bacterium]